MTSSSTQNSNNISPKALPVKPPPPMDPEVEEILNSIPTKKRPSAPKKKAPPAKGIKAKWKIFKQATLKAMQRHKEMSFSERLKKQGRDYHIGLAKGYLRGIEAGTGELLTGRSPLINLGPKNLYNKTQTAGEEILDFGIDYMNADYKTRGELAGKATIKTAIWIVGLRNLVSGFKKLGKKILK